MTQIILEGLDPLILECLENRAQKHGHSLQAEVKSILKQVAELEIKSNLFPEKIIQLKSALMLQQIEHHDQKMGRSVQWCAD